MAKGYAHKGYGAKGYRLVQLRVVSVHPIDGSHTFSNTVPIMTKDSIKSIKAQYNMPGYRVLDIWTLDSKGQAEPYDYGVNVTPARFVFPNNDFMKSLKTPQPSPELLSWLFGDGEQPE